MATEQPDTLPVALHLGAILAAPTRTAAGSDPAATAAATAAQWALLAAWTTHFLKHHLDSNPMTMSTTLAVLPVAVVAHFVTQRERGWWEDDTLKQAWRAYVTILFSLLFSMYFYVSLFHVTDEI